jgi:uncharacterized iron-regulated membrane protein
LKMKDNYNVLNEIHHNLFLGATTLRQFRDARLVVGVAVCVTGGGGWVGGRGGGQQGVTLQSTWSGVGV